MRFLISSVRRQLLAAFMGVSAIFLVAVALGWTGIGAVDAKVQSAAKEQQVLRCRALLGPAETTSQRRSWRP